MKALLGPFFMIEFGSHIVWLFILILIGFGAAIAFYRFRPESFSGAYRSILIILRSITLILVMVFLLDPVIKTIAKEVEKPVLLLGVDHSKSMVSNGDSTELKSLISSVNDRIHQLEERFAIKTFSIGSEVYDHVQQDYSYDETDLSAFFTYAENNYKSRNIASIVLITDGLYNKGSNPAYFQPTLNAPVHVLALGDTSMRPDQRIGNVLFNKLVYRHNKFPVRLSISAEQLKGRSTVLTLTAFGEKYTRKVNYTKDQELLHFDFELDAEKTGQHIIRVELNAFEEEVNSVNNVVEFPIQVIESKQNVAVVYDDLTPDIGAIKRTLERGENIKVNTYSIYQLSKEKLKLIFKENDALIIYRLPGINAKYSSALVHDLFVSKELPRFVICGPETNLNALNRMKLGFHFKAISGSANTVAPMFNKDFYLFQLPNTRNEIGAIYPPLNAPFAEVTFSGSTQILAYQGIGNIKTEQGLWSFTEQNGFKQILLLGNDFWRWELAEFNRTGKKQLFHSIWEKSLSYLSIKKDKSRLRLDNKNTYKQNEPVTLNAQLFNELYEPIIEPPLTLKLLKDDSLSYDYQFKRGAGSYSLSMGKLAPGVYTYTASAEVNGKAITKSGQFSVSTFNIEYSALRADHSALYQLANNTNGKVFLKGNSDELLTTLSELESQPEVFEQLDYIDLINVKWIAGIILLLLTVEWLLRKREGYL